MAGCEEHQAIVVRVKSLQEGVSKLSTRMDGMESLATLTGKGQAVMEAELKNINNSLSRIEESIKDRKSTRLNSSHSGESRMPSSA